MVDSLKEAVARRIREARKNAKLTQQHISDRLGCSKQNVSHWETARWFPSHEDLGPLSKLLGVSIDWILTGVDPAPGSSLRNARRPVLIPYPTREQIVEIARGNLDPATVTEYWLSGLLDSDDLIVVDAPDEGMHGQIPQGAKVTLKRGKLPEPGEIGLWVLLATREVLLRRYRPGISGKPGVLPYILRGDHVDYGERTVTSEDKPVVVGTMVAVSKTGSR